MRGSVAGLEDSPPLCQLIDPESLPSHEEGGKVTTVSVTKWIESPREALELGHELWLWLYANPDKTKGDWPRWDELGLMDAACPLCQWKNQEGTDCAHCLITWGDGLIVNHCSIHGSPYHRWALASWRKPRSKKYWARKVVNLHKEALEVLDEKEEHTTRS